MNEYTIAGEIRGAYEALKQALSRLVPAVRAQHDIDFEWCAAGMDVNIRATAVAPAGAPLEYIVTGYMQCSGEDAIARCTYLMQALDGHGLAYRIELDDEEVGENVLTRARGVT